QAWAVIKGREYVLPDDVKELAKDVLGHRIIIKPEVKLRGLTSEDVLTNILRQVHIPVVRRYV
ncbi:MAG TPA: AAA family ATPase, partial [Clostridiaceae bacterium]|nr:AAA family ATPase [Clostridiaceae bacterium]